MIKLKPCPICGAEAVIINNSGVGYITCSKECEFYEKVSCINFFGRKSWYPSIMFQFGDHVQRKKKEAIVQWNAFELPELFEQKREDFEFIEDGYLFD